MSARTSTSVRCRWVSRLRRLARHIERMRRSAFAAAGLEPWEFDVLSALRRMGEPHEMSPTALVAETGG